MPSKRAERPGPYLRFCVIVLIPLINLAWRRRWYGAQRIPASGPAIVVANHISYADPFVVARFIWDTGRVPRFLAKAGLFSVPVIGRIVRGAGQIPVHRGTQDADHALHAAVETLRSGGMVLIYPEGTVTRDPDFWPMQAKTGVARLALLVPEAPVIPVGQWGAQKFLDVYARRFSPLPRKTVELSVGEPVDLSEWRGSGPTPQNLHAMTDEIMRAVRVQVAELRGEQPPADFYLRPSGVGVRASDAVNPTKPTKQNREESA